MPYSGSRPFSVDRERRITDRADLGDADGEAGIQEPENIFT